MLSTQSSDSNSCFSACLKALLKRVANMDTIGAVQATRAILLLLSDKLCALSDPTDTDISPVDAAELIAKWDSMPGYLIAYTNGANGPETIDYKDPDGNIVYQKTITYDGSGNVATQTTAIYVAP